MAISARNLFPPVSAGLRVGLYGGSFNPVHAGHIHVAKSAKMRLQLDAIWWLVSPGNPLKGETGQADYAGRLAGVKNAINGLNGHYVCTAEAAMNTRYSVDLIRAVRAIRPAIRPVWVMGGDNLANFHHWKDWQMMMEMVPVAVVARPHDPVRARFAPMARVFSPYRLPQEAASILADQVAPAWVYLAGPLHDHSSTQLRALQAV